eukprot:TRINITY_DN2366_c0_g1_i2.p1 TRINITY_DN2366_c0_g1~~TRINITY_DN2366_c0_g1_i2.p1  ORF type:complete len:247 (+),score=35.26 TRINITY_DN2366_c0_g1_i2:55-795(+)
MIRRFATNSGRVLTQSRTQMSIRDIESAISKLEPKSGSSKGMEKLRDALKELKEEAQAKKEMKADELYNYFIVHVTGPERIGMLADVATTVSEHSIDVLSSRASLLGGDFSMMIHVRSKKNALELLTSELKKVSGIEAWVHKSGPSADNTIEPGRVGRVVTLSGENKVGILSSLIKFYTKHDIVIMNFASEMAVSPVGKPPMFKCRFVLDLPQQLTREEICSGITSAGESIGSSISVDSFLHCEAM